VQGGALGCRVLERVAFMHYNGNAAVLGNPETLKLHIKKGMHGLIPI
jgi:hypothetical protein